MRLAVCPKLDGSIRPQDRVALMAGRKQHDHIVHWGWEADEIRPHIREVRGRLPPRRTAIAVKRSD